jgi:hypothetical protein
MRHIFAVPITAAVVIASLLAGCGDDTSSNGDTTATAAASAVCADISKMLSAANDFNKLDRDNDSATEVKQAIFALGTSVHALSSSASEGASQAQASLRSAVSSFQSQLKSAAGKPVSQQLVALGNAVGELETSLIKAAGDLNCNQQGT